jgi:hypothetical protein
MNDFDFDDVDSGAQDAIDLRFPTLVWRNGDSSLEELGAENINYSGGFFFGYENAGADTVIKDWSPAAFKTEGKKVQGIAARKAAVTFVRSRRRWFQQDQNGRKQFRPWNNYQEGFRAQIQLIGFIKGYPDPVCFPFKGLSVSEIDNIQKEHYSKIVSLANRQSPDATKRLPAYAFWTVIEAGPHKYVGDKQKSEATMPKIVLTGQLTLETAKKLYVGRDQLKASQELYRLAEGWSHRWDGAYVQQERAAPAAAGGRNMPEDPYGEAPLDDTAPMGKDDDLPF